METALSAMLLYQLVAFWLPLVVCTILYCRVHLGSGDRTDAPGCGSGKHGKAPEVAPGKKQTRR